MMSEPRQSIVRFAKTKEHGADAFDLAIGILDNPRGDRLPTEFQLDAIGAFYGFTPDDLTFRQAHQLLCLRDFALALLDSEMPQLGDAKRRTISVFVACFLAADEVRYQLAVEFVERLYKREGSLRALVGHVRRSSIFGEAASFLGDVLVDMKAAGADLHMKATPL